MANAAIEGAGQVLVLEHFAKLVPELVFSTIRRVDQRRMITVAATSEERTAFERLDHVQPDLDALAEDLGPAYAINVAGEVERSSEGRARGFPAALTVMLLALMVQFNRFRRVGITLLSVPLVIAGVPGLIALSGIIINNAIVLIDQIDIARETMDRDDAIVAAARKRFRPSC